MIPLAISRDPAWLGKTYPLAELEDYPPLSSDLESQTSSATGQMLTRSRALTARLNSKDISDPQIVTMSDSVADDEVPLLRRPNSSNKPYFSPVMTRAGQHPSAPFPDMSLSFAPSQIKFKDNGMDSHELLEQARGTAGSIARRLNAEYIGPMLHASGLSSTINSISTTRRRKSSMSNSDDDIRQVTASDGRLYPPDPKPKKDDLRQRKPRTPASLSHPSEASSSPWQTVRPPATSQEALEDQSFFFDLSLAPNIAPLRLSNVWKE